MCTVTPTADVDTLYEQSMKLPPQQRLVLGERILDSVPMFCDREEEEQLAAIVERRWQEIVEGKVQTIPGDEVFRRIRERLDRRDQERDAQ